ncbi:MAG: 4Fe-4S binding protein, partial [Planctomycetaceae bacterium]
MTQIATEPGRVGPVRGDTPRLCIPQPLTLIDVYLDEQQRLSAVEQFARDLERDHVPAQAKLYAKLMPATPPRPGEQYAFQVDLDRCSGCKACVTACHSLNGLDEDEVWR